MEKHQIYCMTCGKQTDACYTDSGALGLSHGWCQCRECYAVEHPECPACKDLTDKQWKYCCHCGNNLKGETK